jgi:hypothetical protein
MRSKLVLYITMYVALSVKQGTPETTLSNYRSKNCGGGGWCCRHGRGARQPQGVGGSDDRGGRDGGWPPVRPGEIRDGGRRV